MLSRLPDAASFVRSSVVCLRLASREDASYHWLAVVTSFIDFPALISLLQSEKKKSKLNEEENTKNNLEVGSIAITGATSAMLPPGLCSPDRQVVFQFIYGVVAVSSLLGPGMSMGYSSVAQPLLKNSTSQPTLTEDEATWFASITVISMPAGCIVSLFTMKAGRRIAIASSGTICSIGWILIATSYTVSQLLIGRFVTGFATGMASSPSCVYLAEISMPRYTAMLTTCSSFFISIGIMIVYVLGFIIKDDWRMVAAFAIVVPTVSAVLTLTVLPESPRWLLDKGRENDARKTLLRLRSLRRETASFKDEFEAMVRYSEPKYDTELTNCQKGDSPAVGTNAKIGERDVESGNRRQPHLNVLGGSLKEFASTLRIPEVWKPLVILNAFFFFQQFCGIYVLMAYAVDLIEKTGVTTDPYFITAIVGLVQTSAAFGLVCCSARLGRRPAALVSGTGMTISLAALGIYNQFFEHTKLSWIPLTCIFLFVVTGSFGFLALPWAMIGELYPTRFVNVLGPTTTCLSALYNFAAVQFYPSLVAYGPITMIYSYCAISFLATVFVALVLPETRGKTKDEIERAFHKRS